MRLFLLLLVCTLLLVGSVSALTLSDTVLRSEGANITINITRYWNITQNVTIKSTGIEVFGLFDANCDSTTILAGQNFNITTQDQVLSGHGSPFCVGSGIANQQKLNAIGETLKGLPGTVFAIVLGVLGIIVAFGIYLVASGSNDFEGGVSTFTSVVPALIIAVGVLVILVVIVGYIVAVAG